MSDQRSELLEKFRSATGRPVRWASEAQGDFEGREWTIEIFDVQEVDQETMFVSLGALRRSAREYLGGTIRVLFHTPQATTRYYASVRPPGYRVPLTIVPSPNTRPRGLVDDDVLGDSRPARSKVG